MKIVLIVLLVGCTVRCNENNYYVIEMLEDPAPKPFSVYWNVPTKQCRSKKIPFDDLYDKFGIIQNELDSFIGDKVTILYDPGLFPALLKNETSGRFKFRNGGVPQEGSLEKHLEAFRAELDQSIPDRDYYGIAIIDFESWRPVYRQNFGALQPYKDVSLEIERKRHWWWQKKWLEAEAKFRFEEAARTFMQATLAVAKQHRPNARWGYYGFPYCFNMASNNMKESCASNVPEENDSMGWLWSESTALFPSLYSSSSLSTSQLRALIRGRVREAARFGNIILPYFWYRYRDAGFLSQVDLNAAISTLYKSNASGFIIWGSSSDVNTVQKCTNLKNYIEQVFGPAVAKYTKRNIIRDDILSLSDNYTHNLCNDTKVNVNTTDSPAHVIELDPEYHWIPPDNYTQNIRDHVAKEITNKLTNYTETENNALSNNNLLIDLILNSVLSNNFSKDNETKVGIENNYIMKENSSQVSGQSHRTTDTTESIQTTESKNMLVSISPVTNNYEITTQIGLEDFINTESSMLFDATITYRRHNEMSHHYDYDNKDETENTTTPTNIYDVTEVTGGMNKISLKHNEEYFDATTETVPTSDTTESIHTISETSTSFNYFDINKNDYHVTGMVEVNKNDFLSISITNKDSNHALKINSQDYSEGVTIETFTNETLDLFQSTSQHPLEKNTDVENYSSTNHFNVNSTTETEEPELMVVNSETVTPDSQENIKILDTVASIFTTHEDSTTSKDYKERLEDTSIALTSSSPAQVVVYV